MKKMLSASALVLGVLGSTSAFAAEEVNVYSYRQPFLIEQCWMHLPKKPVSR